MSSVPNAVVDGAGVGLSWTDQLVHNFLASIGVNSALFLLGASIIFLAIKSDWLLSKVVGFFYFLQRWGFVGKLLLIFVGIMFIGASVGFDVLGFIGSKLGGG